MWLRCVFPKGKNVYDAYDWLPHGQFEGNQLIIIHTSDEKVTLLYMANGVMSTCNTFSERLTSLCHMSQLQCHIRQVDINVTDSTSMDNFRFLKWTFITYITSMES